MDASPSYTLVPLLRGIYTVVAYAFHHLEEPESRYGCIPSVGSISIPGTTAKNGCQYFTRTALSAISLRPDSIER